MRERVSAVTMTHGPGKAAHRDLPDQQSLKLASSLDRDYTPAGQAITIIMSYCYWGIICGLAMMKSVCQTPRPQN